MKIDEIIETYKNANILILGNGPTGFFDTSDYWKDFDDRGFTWTVNGNWRTHTESTLGFMMDDWLSPAHDTDISTRETKAEALKKVTIPILTTNQYPEFKCFVKYPLAQVVNFFEMAYFGETIAYMVAFAIFCGVKRIDFHGTDYQGCKPAERAGTEFWCGQAIARGIDIRANLDSHFLCTQLDNRNNHMKNLYGYLPDHFPYEMKVLENGKLWMQDKA